jgi:site-specific recombinase XerD
MAAFPVHDAGLAPGDQLVLRASVSAYLGRYRGETRLHTESDLRVFLHWCTDHDLDPHAATRRLKHLATSAGVRMPRMHPHMLRHPS